MVLCVVKVIELSPMHTP